MREDIAGPQGTSSRPIWETLEGMVREKVQEFIQQIMEEEVTELLGRAQECGGRGRGLPQRIRQTEAAGDELGHDHPPTAWVRGVEERFESRVLPLFARRTKELGALLPEPARAGGGRLRMRGLLGEGAPLSKSSGDCGQAGRQSSRPGRAISGRPYGACWATPLSIRVVSYIRSYGAPPLLDRYRAVHVSRMDGALVIVRSSRGWHGGLKRTASLCDGVGDRVGVKRYVV